jgi:hypothetical protein
VNSLGAVFSVPKLAIPNADFVREGQAIPVSQASPATPATLTPRTIKMIVLATSELLRNPAAEDLVRQVLIESTGPALDRQLFSSVAGNDERPAGSRPSRPPATSSTIWSGL